MKNITQEVVRVIHTNLKELGYNDLTLDYVQAEVLSSLVA